MRLDEIDAALRPVMSFEELRDPRVGYSYLTLFAARSTRGHSPLHLAIPQRDEHYI